LQFVYANAAGADIAGHKVAQADIDVVYPNDLPEIYTKLVGAPPFLEPNSFKDGTTYPSSAFAGGRMGKRKSKKRRRKNYY